jgi:hypothetical protein
VTIGKEVRDSRSILNCFRITVYCGSAVVQVHRGVGDLVFSMVVGGHAPLRSEA